MNFAASKPPFSADFPTFPSASVASVIFRGLGTFFPGPKRKVLVFQPRQSTAMFVKECHRPHQPSPSHHPNVGVKTIPIGGNHDLWRIILPTLCRFKKKWRINPQIIGETGMIVTKHGPPAPAQSQRAFPCLTSPVSNKSTVPCSASIRITSEMCQHFKAEIVAW